MLEALVAVGLTAMLLAVFSTILFSTVFLRRTQANIQAVNFIQEEIDSLRSLPFDELTLRTNGNFLGVARHRGTWGVSAVSGTPSAANALSHTAAGTATVEQTGLALLPGNYRDDFTSFTAKVKVRSSPPSGWGAGLAFRYRDAENHYRFRISSGGSALDKVVRGVRTTVWSNTTANAANTWYTLDVSATGGTIVVKRNGVTLTTQTDSAFTEGDVALLTLNSALADFDDVAVTDASGTSTWNFDADAAGSLPTDWRRLSPFDLPGGNGTLTIANYLGDADIKQATVNVTWTDGGVTRSSSGTTLIAE